MTNKTMQLIAETMWTVRALIVMCAAKRSQAEPSGGKMQNNLSLWGEPRASRALAPPGGLAVDVISM